MENGELDIEDLSKKFDKILENLTVEEVDKFLKLEEELVVIAQMSIDDNAANYAMKMLREDYDKTYSWCDDCDGLVVKAKDCCLNKK